MMEPIPLETRPRELALMYSRRCNIACRHCGIESSPYVRGEMGLPAATRFIAEAASIPQFMKMTFTGGEPMLYQNEHIQLFELCAGLGLQTRMVTNGFWARDRQKGYSLLKRLKEAGLCELNFSADIFHLEFQKRETLHHAPTAQTSWGSRGSSRLSPTTSRGRRSISSPTCTDSTGTSCAICATISPIPTCWTRRRAAASSSTRAA